MGFQRKSRMRSYPFLSGNQVFLRRLVWRKPLYENAAFRSYAGNYLRIPELLWKKHIWSALILCFWAYF